MERRMDRRERERERSRQSNLNDRVDLDSRTPLAWQHRDFNYQQHGSNSNQQSAFNDRYPEGVPSSSSDRFSHPSLGSRSARSAAAAASDRGLQRQSENEQPANRMPPAPRGAASKKASNSSTGTATAMAEGASSGAGGANRNSARPSRSSEETTTGSSSETETDAERGQPSRPGTSGTLRSMQSMPLLSPLHHPGAMQGFNPMMSGIYGVVGMPQQPGNPTWNGEPCPVHGAGIPPHMSIAHYQTPHGAIAAAYPPIYSSMSMKRAASIHEMAMATPLPALMPPPGPIYGTLQHGPPTHQFLMPAPPPSQEPTHFVMMTGPPSMMGPPASSLGGRKTRHAQRSGPGSLPPMPPPSQMATLQHQHRTLRPLVVNGKNGQPEPLPVRDAPPLPPKIPPSDVASKTASKASSVKPFSYKACCKGNVVVLWVILGIIGLGVVMAVVFYYAFQ